MALSIDFNDSAQLYFTACIYCLHGKLTVKFHYVRSHVNAEDEVTLHRSEILLRIEISNWFEFTSGLM